MTDRRAATLALFFLVSPVLAIGGLGMDAKLRSERKTQEEPAVRAVAKRLPTNDLALSGGARWLRTVSVEEPGAAFADGPALPDPDPVGAAMAPPVEVWSRVTESEKKR